MCTIANNFIGDNAAGIYVETYSNVNSNALYANISNNVIIYTTHGEPLHVEGHYFQVRTTCKIVLLIYLVTIE